MFPATIFFLYPICGARTSRRRSYNLNIFCSYIRTYRRRIIRNFSLIYACRKTRRPFCRLYKISFTSRYLVIKKIWPSFFINSPFIFIYRNCIAIANAKNILISLSRYIRFDNKRSNFSISRINSSIKKTIACNLCA